MGARSRFSILVFMAACTLAGIAALLWEPWGPWAAGILLVVQFFLFYSFVSSARQPAATPFDLERLSASFDTTLRISDETLPYLKQGLNFESAQKITEIMHKITDVDAVAITDTEQILGFSGNGCRRHHQGGPILTDATRDVLRSGQPKVVMDHAVLSCDEPDCPHPLKSAVIAPLRYRHRVVGTFKLYRTSQEPLPPHLARLAIGIAQLLGIQMELGEVDRHRQLVTKARLEALQAQIRPHFLFNVLNTIIHFSRTDVEKSRSLLIQLAIFFRRSLSYRTDFITLKEEIEYIDTYLALEKARFGEKLQVRYKLDPRALGCRVPILTLQPLVENAVVHGIAPKEGRGEVGLLVRRAGEYLNMLVWDTGVGIASDRMGRIFHAGFGEGTGVGLTNVNERLISLYGAEFRLRVRSIPGRGTAVRMRIPFTLAGPERELAAARATGRD